MAAHDVAESDTVNTDLLEQRVQTEGMNLYQTAMSDFLSLPNIRLEKTFNLQFQSVISDALDVMQNTTGRITLLLPSGAQKKIRYRRAYTADILHALVASSLGCDEFVTFDKSVKKLESHPRIVPMQIVTY